jgi:hypothetical protein
MPWQSSRANEATQYEQPFGGIISCANADCVIRTVTAQPSTDFVASAKVAPKKSSRC